ncbi:MAG: ATP-binding protein [Sphaerochaeta sp.]|nr:ATP-binding protein [Sphaerochaeta sp.]
MLHLIQNELEQGQKVYLFFDEVQELEGWEKLVNSCMIDFACDIYITGSNATLLSGELATYLGGRYVEFPIFPLSFKEVLPTCEGSKLEAFQTYLQRGGMPFLYQVAMNEDASTKYLEDIFDSIIIKDIARRENIRDIELLRRIILFLMANMGNTFSAQSIVAYLKSEKHTLSMETLYNYIEYGKRAFLFQSIPRYDIAGKALLSFQEKIYLTDHGFREALLGSGRTTIHQTLGNIVCQELLRRGFTVRVGKQKTKEVDFVAFKQEEKIYVQVTYLLASPETEEREFGVLEAIQDNHPKYVLSMDPILRNRSGIVHQHIIDFLLGVW